MPESSHSYPSAYGYTPAYMQCPHDMPHDYSEAPRAPFRTTPEIHYPTIPAAVSVPLSFLPSGQNHPDQVPDFRVPPSAGYLIP